MNSLTIDNRIIAPDYPPYVIAELSANHNGKIETAFKLIDQAKLAGADAVKLQTYTPDTITLNCSTEDFQIKDGLWSGRTLYELYKKAHMPWDWHKPLFDHAREIGITIFSSPFDNSAVDLLENLNAPAYKIASFEAIDLPLIKYAARTGKPMIISTGMASLEEIHEAIDAAKSSGCTQLATLHCVSGYPSPASDYNLRTIADMRIRFGVVTGLSDHTLDNTTSITSIAMGASIVEKHFTLDRNGGGPDDSFSLEPSDLKALCIGVRTAWDAMGNVNYEQQLSEITNVKFRRSLYFVKNAKAGDVVTEDHIRSVRPGLGLAPKFFEEVTGKKLLKAAAFGTPVSRDYFE